MFKTRKKISLHSNRDTDLGCTSDVVNLMHNSRNGRLDMQKKLHLSSAVGVLLQRWCTFTSVCYWVVYSIQINLSCCKCMTNFKRIWKIKCSFIIDTTATYVRIIILPVKRARFLSVRSNAFCTILTHVNYVISKCASCDVSRKRQQVQLTVCYLFCAVKAGHLRLKHI